MIVQQGLRTPTGPCFGSYCIRGTRGLSFLQEAIEKVDGVVFRCTVSGSAVDRWLEVPAWMFERAACPDHAQLTAAPFIDMTALSALADLLRQVLKDRAASSNAPHSGASESGRPNARLMPVHGFAHDLGRAD